MRRFGMLLADVVLGAMLAGAVLPLLLANDLVGSQTMFWTLTIFCIVLVAILHGTLSPPPR